MVEQPSVIETPDLGVEYSASVLLPWDQYSISMTNFPGLNTHGPWGRHGAFHVRFTLYSEGKRLGEICSRRYTEREVIEAALDDLVSFYSPSGYGLIILEYFHEKTIPVAGYLSVIDRATGTYAPLPVLPYMGDEAYPDAHSNALENAMFWPGLVANDEVVAKIAIVNPYRQSFLYQLHLFLEDGSRVQTATKKLPPLSTTVHELDIEFADSIARVREFSGRCSVCISSQHKVLPLMLFENRRTKIVTSIDHLHPYSLI